jgi:hypothetical protein
MKVSAPSLILPIVAGVSAGTMIHLHAWDNLRSALLPALSVIAAAVLVRLARGLPFTNADHFTLSEFRSVAGKMEANARKLRALIFVCLIALAVLTFGSGIVAAIASVPRILPWVPQAAGGVTSGLIAALVVYAFTRVVEVVHSDVGLLRLQAKVLEGVIASKNAAKFERQVEATNRPGIAGADRFGTRLQ